MRLHPPEGARGKGRQVARALGEEPRWGRRWTVLAKTKLGDYLRFHLALIFVPQPRSFSHTHDFLQRELGWDRRLTWPISCLASVPGVPGEGNGSPLQCSCLENPRDGGACWATVHGVAKSQTRLSDFTFTFHFHALDKEMAAHSSVLAWRIPGTGDPAGLPSMGSHRVRHDCSDLAAAAAEFAKCSYGHL